MIMIASIVVGEGRLLRRGIRRGGGGGSLRAGPARAGGAGAGHAGHAPRRGRGAGRLWRLRALPGRRLGAGGLRQPDDAGGPSRRRL